MSAASKIKGMIKEAEDAWRVHKKRGDKGQIEALGARIRIRALYDALSAVEGDNAQP